jgi:hypothetical protein
MSNQTSKLRVRFHGRFLFVTKQDELIVLAVDMDKDKRRDENAKRNEKINLHNVFMTVREQHVVRPLEKEREPSYRLFGGHVVPTFVGDVKENRVGNLVPYDGANLAWNIANCDVAVEANGRFRWVDDTGFKLANLAELAPNKKVDERYLHSVESGKTTAIIRLPAGEGRAYHELPAEPPYNKDMQYKFQRPSGGEIPPACLADLVEVTIPLSASIDVKFVREGSIVRLRSTTWSSQPAKAPNPCLAIGFPIPKELGEIKISSDVVLAFSNLCTTSPGGGVDSEFGRFYEVLVDPPDDEDRFIPSLYPPPIQSIRFMGDCYLAAQIAYQE